MKKEITEIEKEIKERNVRLKKQKKERILANKEERAYRNIQWKLNEAEYYLRKLLEVKPELVNKISYIRSDINSIGHQVFKMKNNIKTEVI